MLSYCTLSLKVYFFLFYVNESFAWLEMYIVPIEARRHKPKLCDLKVQEALRNYLPSLKLITSSYLPDSQMSQSHPLVSPFSEAPLR